MKKVVVLGATGSVGSSVLAVIRENPGCFAVSGLAAGHGGPELVALCREFPDALVAIHDPEGAALLRDSCDGIASRLLTGPDAGRRLASEVDADICVAAVSGTAGLGMAFAAARRGMRILLANKEVLVSAGRLFFAEARRGGAEVIPLDSEHSALFQCLQGRDPASVNKVIITASGGPFRDWSAECMAGVAPEDALRHPVWKMGKKISIDSASMANKALEIIETSHLFSVPLDSIEVLVHRESLIHGLIEFCDGAVLAHLGAADMRLPAAFGLFYPERTKKCFQRLNLAEIGQLHFESPCFARFPLLRLGIEAGKRGECASATFNAANEMAVDLFLSGKIGFCDMAAVVEVALAQARDGDFASLSAVEDAHQQARECVRKWSGR